MTRLSRIRNLFGRKPSSARAARRRGNRRKGPPARLALEALEDRLAPALFTVNTLADTVDADPAVTSLREAISQANSQAGDDTIQFSVTGTINLTAALPELSTNLTIQGPGAGSLTVRRDTGGNYRIFQVDSGATVALFGLTLANGSADFFGGGIGNGGTLTVTNSTLSGNAAGDDGGGIFNFGTLTVTSSTLSGNAAGAFGGGIFNFGTLTVTSSTLSGNAAFFGGGIRNNGTLTVTNSTLSGNSATIDGGGIINDLGTVTVVNSTLTGNVANADGDGFGSGGGIWTFNDNRTFTTLHNTIVAGNRRGTGAGTPDELASKNVEAASAHNLIGDAASAGGLVNGTNGNRVGVDPRLGPLANNGGPTLTHALLPGSLAINAGSNARVPSGITTDQRGPGFLRIRDGTVDIGAFEVQSGGPFIVTNLNDAGDGSLRQAILAANAAPGPDIVTFQDGLTGTIPLTSGQLSATDDLIIIGPGASRLTVSGNNASRVFNMSPGGTRHFSISGLTIANGRADFGSGLQYAFTSGTLTIEGCVFSGNTASAQLGGLLVEGNGISATTVTISNTTFANNQAGFAGAAGFIGATVTLSNCTVSGNSATTLYGGLVVQDADVTLRNCTLADNSGPLVDALAIVSGVARYANTIFSSNAGGSPNIAANSSSSMISLGHNLSDDGSGNLTAAGDRPNTNPLLAPLGDYGGPTPTHALLPGSPAINGGSNALVPGGITTDQRGVARIVNGTVDIGAVESRGFTMTVTGGSNQQALVNTAFAARLSVQVTSAFGEPVLGGVVTFAAPASGASATFAGGPTAILNASGQASRAVTANGTAGGYTVTAAAPGAAPVAFNLTNLPLIVLSPATLPNATLSAPYSQQLTATGGAGGPFAFAVTAGTLPTGLTLASSGLLAGTPTVVGTSTFTVTATGSGGFTGSQSYTLTVVNTPPTIARDQAAVTVAEGSPATNTGTFDDVQGRGNVTLTASLGTVTKNDTAGTWSWTHTPADGPAGPTTVTITATDSGGLTATTTFTLTVNNVAPTAAVSGPSSGVRGQPRRFTLSASDVSSVDQAAGFVYTITWGDGQTQTVPATAGNGSGVSVDHVFTAAGTYIVIVTATDKDNGTSAAVTHTITIGAIQLQGTDLVVGGTTGNDLIVINPGGPGTVQVVFGGVPQGGHNPTGKLVVYGQAGDDVIQVAGGVSLPAWLYGGDGNDILTGGNGDNVLVGGAGNDILSGGQGGDLLIGGLGADVLTGNAGDDLLIAGTTAFDGDSAALAAIMAEWTSARSYADRVANLRGSGSGPRANGSIFLKVSGPDVTVYDDGAVDVLSGNSGSDWFFANLSGAVADELFDLGGSELVEELAVLGP